MGDRPVLPHAIHAEVWKAITFVSILYSLGLEVLSCGVVLSLETFSTESFHSDGDVGGRRRLGRGRRCSRQNINL